MRHWTAVLMFPISTLAVLKVYFALFCRCFGRPRQPCELPWRDRGRNGRVHRILGQLLENMELNEKKKNKTFQNKYPPIWTIRWQQSKIQKQFLYGNQSDVPPIPYITSMKKKRFDVTLQKKGIVMQKCCDLPLTTSHKSSMVINTVQFC